MYHHSYDNSMKAILQEDAAEIVLYLLPGAIFVDVLDIEIIRDFQEKLETKTSQQ